MNGQFLGQLDDYQLLKNKTKKTLIFMELATTTKPSSYKFFLNGKVIRQYVDDFIGRKWPGGGELILTL